MAAQSFSGLSMKPSALLKTISCVGYVILVAPWLGHGLSVGIESSFTSKPASFDQSSRYSTGFYVHIPYCRRRCRYCSFAIVPVGLSTDAEVKQSSFGTIHQQYQSDIFAELDMLIRQQGHGKPIKLSSIYFGGGTPSLAPVAMIEGILDRILKSPFELEEDAEITMEMDPGTFSLEQLRSLKNLGINRISLGVQSFDDSILEAMGRVHRRSDIMKAIEIIHQVFAQDKANFSIDLISGVPGLTPAKWIATLETATSLCPSHLSIYDLQVEEGTVFSTWYKNQRDDQASNTAVGSTISRTFAKIPTLPNEEAVAFMYKFGAGYLKRKGYEHYEVSSYAYRGVPKGNDSELPQHLTTSRSLRSRHNQIYWAPSSSWYAVGLGATSCVQGHLQERPKTMADYHDWIAEKQRKHSLESAKPGVASEAEGTVLADDDLLTDIIMKRLRTSDGLDLDWIQDKFGADTRETILKGATLGLELKMAEIIPKNDATDPLTPNEQRATISKGTVLRLTDPNGFLYSNYIISSIFAELGYE